MKKASAKVFAWLCSFTFIKLAQHKQSIKMEAHKLPAGMVQI